jgi:hypothetical protein
MPLEPTGKKAGKRPIMPYKLATILMYGIVPGVKVLGPGLIYANYNELGHYVRMTNHNIKLHLELLKEWGVVEDIIVKRGSCVIKFKQPRLWNVDANG